MVTALSLTIILAIITLAPIVLGILTLMLERFGWATSRIAIALAVVGAVVPAAGVALLGPAVASGDPISIRPFGPGSGFGAWVMPVYRVDTFAVYAAIGATFLVVPTVLWAVFAQHSQPAPELATQTEAADEASAPAADASAAAPALAGEQRWLGSRIEPAVARAAAFVLILSSAALTAIFADGLVLMGVMWLVTVAAAWAVGEAASDRAHLDRGGLGAAAIGPAIWLVIMIIAGRVAQGTRFSALTSTKPLNIYECIGLALAVSLAAGGYPAVAWIRRRCAFAAPAGIGALVLGAVPLALYVATRTYAVATDSLDRWPIIGPTTSTSNSAPPITAGIAFAVLGAATVAVAGVLALGRRDARALIGLLASAQVGWLLVALGAGRPVSMLGLITVLASSLLGLGAMLVPVIAGDTITTDIEPDADGPRPVGAPFRPVNLAAWAIGAATLIGMPLFGGFPGRQLITAGMLQAGGLAVPLCALCWAGDGLLALALLRATAPALVESIKGAAAQSGHAAFAAREAPAAILGALALVLGVLPGVVLNTFGAPAAQALLSASSLSNLLKADVIGYSAGPAQWLSAIGWLVVLIVGVIVLAVQPAGSVRLFLPAFIGGRAELPAAQASAEESGEALESPAALGEPADAWSDLRGAFTSPFTLPAREWLLAGIDDDLDAEDESTEAPPDEADTAEAMDDDAPVEEREETVAAQAEEAGHGDD
jgi:formate hydrogenlyase subunit 3/multisubunit Na+/H+ antiporter MnhD subunit